MMYNVNKFINTFCSPQQKSCLASIRSMYGNVGMIQACQPPLPKIVTLYDFKDEYYFKTAYTHNMYIAWEDAVMECRGTSIRGKDVPNKWCAKLNISITYMNNVSTGPVFDAGNITMGFGFNEYSGLSLYVENAGRNWELRDMTDDPYIKKYFKYAYNPNVNDYMAHGELIAQSTHSTDKRWNFVNYYGATDITSDENKNLEILKFGSLYQNNTWAVSNDFYIVNYKRYIYIFNANGDVVTWLKPTEESILYFYGYIFGDAIRGGFCTKYLNAGTSKMLVEFKDIYDEDLEVLKKIKYLE